MSIQVNCPGGHVVQIKDKYAGRRGKCPLCGTPIDVPGVRRLSEDEIAALMYGPPAIEDDSVVHDDHARRDGSGMSLAGSSAVGGIGLRVCPKCRAKVYVPENLICPQCNSHFSDWG